uniref:RING-type E3 ubiquitin transferase n=1 Tax=Globisporangium ultimum (strain ATCC 200006 / CBS 805.95 / DAOM BR144) TaxID=431595 RepID=K3WWP8_GLOUD
MEAFDDDDLIDRVIADGDLMDTSSSSDSDDEEYAPPAQRTAFPLTMEALRQRREDNTADEEEDEVETEEFDTGDESSSVEVVEAASSATASNAPQRLSGPGQETVVGRESSDENDLVVEEPAVPNATTGAKKGRKRPRSETKTEDKDAMALKPIVVIKAQATECTVCYDPCTISGRHRLVALKCGHLFGKKCIERWVLERKSCPNCNVPVRKADIRPLFSDHVAVVDNSGIEGMTQKYELERSKRIQAETELSRTKLQMQILTAEVKCHEDKALKWKKEFTQLQCRVQRERFTNPNSGWSSSVTAAAASQPMQSQSSEWSPPRHIYKYALTHARVFDIARSCSMLCVGETLTNTRCGILQLSAVDPRHSVRIYAHQSPVRDLKINKTEALVLTVAFDGKLVVSNLHSQTTVLQCSLPPGKRQGWSCAFSDVDPFAMYCGFHDGSIAKFDMRKPVGQAVVSFYAAQEKQPVHSVRLFQGRDGKECLVAATFSGISIWNDCNATPSADIPHVVDLHATVTSCCSLGSVQTRPGSVLVSSRTLLPTPAKHAVFDLTQISSRAAPVSHAVVSGHRTPPVLARSAIWESQGGSLMVASGDEDSKQVLLWDVDTNQVRHRVRPFDGNQVVIDVQHSVANGQWRNRKALFGALSSQEIVLYST